MCPTPYKPMWSSSCSDKLFKTKADMWGTEEGAACDISQLSLLTILIKQTPVAPAWEGCWQRGGARRSLQSTS